MGVATGGAGLALGLVSRVRAGRIEGVAVLSCGVVGSRRVQSPLPPLRGVVERHAGSERLREFAGHGLWPSGGVFLSQLTNASSEQFGGCGWNCP